MLNQIINTVSEIITMFIVGMDPSSMDLNEFVRYTQILNGVDLSLSIVIYGAIAIWIYVFMVKYLSKFVIRVYEKYICKN